MITRTIHTLIVAALLILLYFVAAMIATGVVLQIVAVLLVLVFIAWCVKAWGLDQ